MREREREGCVKYKSLIKKDQANNRNYEERCVYYSYNKSQQDTLFLNFILVKNSTCFGQTYYHQES